MVCRGRAIARVVSHRSVNAEPRFRARFSHVGLVMGEVALGQAFLRIFHFPLSI
jgi:hypothetical protein